jgi:pyruvate dehydrogenase E1 component alpha subunit
VAEAVRCAAERARAGVGATLIEAATYRLGDHTTVDDARRYRDDAEVSRHWESEPIMRLRNYLAAERAWGKADEEELLERCTAETDAAAEQYLAVAPEAPTAMFDHLYAQLPAELAAQRQAVAGAAGDG